MPHAWKTVDTFKDKSGTTMALQQKYRSRTDGYIMPDDEHRVIPVAQLV